MTSTLLPTVDPLLSWREEFPILARTTYLVSNSLGAMPRAAERQLAAYADQWATRGVRAWADGWWAMPLTVGDAVAPLIGAHAGEVAMIPTVSAGHASVVTALPYDDGRDTIVMTALDFPSVRYTVEALAARLGARVVVVPSEDGLTIDAHALHAAIDERTRLVAVSHVLFKSAYVLDAAALVQHAHAQGALVALDAYHAVGVLPVDVHALGVDFYLGGVLKWLCGGPGGSFLYVSPAVRDRHLPAVTGWQAHRTPFAFAEQMEPASGLWRWLGGTPTVPALFAAIEGPRLLAEAGVRAIRAKSERQTAALIAAAESRGWTVNAPREAARRGGTVAIDVPHAYEVAQALLARDILVDFRDGVGIRVAPHFYTRDDEIEQCVAAIDEILATGAWTPWAGRRGVVT
ncbi:MAG: aminotransferase class V-fold PLP-dependent enzyme [Gemmatimonadaceae bacterium]|nr:aminotransferase class V-fold PLP-dependent enzyme [Gemmatimonadaceae bacterium]